MSPFILSQFFAALTLLTGIAAFQCRARVTILRGWCLAATFAAIHFYLLGSTAASMLVAVTALRFLVSSLTTDARLMWLFLGLASGGFALTYTGPVSLLAFAATLIGTVGSFHGTQRAVRFSMMAAELLWAVHNIIVWSPVAIIMEALFFASNLLGMLRQRKAGAAEL